PAADGPGPEAHSGDLQAGGAEGDGGRGRAEVGHVGLSAIATASRKPAAVVSGAVSLMKAPAPSSEPARYFSFSAVRCRGVSSMWKWLTCWCSPSSVGAWCMDMT